MLKGIRGLTKAVDETRDEQSSMKSQQDELIQNYDQLDKRTQAAMEGFTKAKNELNSLSDVENSLKRLQIQLGREQRMAYGDPVKRMLSHPGNKARINAAIRMAVDKKGDLDGVAQKILSKALGEDSTPGSNIIDDALSQEIYDTLATYGIWNTFAVRNLGTKVTKLIVNTARPNAQFILTEGGPIPDDDNKANTVVSATAEVIAVLLNISLQLLDDAEYDIAEEVMRDFMEAYAYRVDYAALQADETADGDNGGMTGVFEGGTAATAADGNTTMETLDFEDFTNCLLTVDPAVLTRAARWWLHPQILVRSLHVKDDNGRPIFLTAIEAPTVGGIGSIVGYPVTPAFAAPTSNTAGDGVAVFGDPLGNVIGMRKDYKFESSDDHKWNALQRSYRGYGRVCNKIRRAEAFAVLTLAAS